MFGIKFFYGNYKYNIEKNFSFWSVSFYKTLNKKNIWYGLMTDTNKVLGPSSMR